MPLTIELPTAVEEALAEEARREGITVDDHVVFLVLLGQALAQTRDDTPFQKAVRTFLASRSLDVENLSQALEELKRTSFDLSREDAVAKEAPRHTRASDERTSRLIGALYHHMRQVAQVAQSFVDHNTGVSKDPALRTDTPGPRTGGTSPRPPSEERPSAFGKYKGLILSSEEFLRRKLDEIELEERNRK